MKEFSGTSIVSKIKFSRVMVSVAGYLIEERRRWPIITASTRGQCVNSEFGRKDEGKPHQSPGRMKNSSYYIAPVGDRTHDLPHTVRPNMVKVSHALTHSATAAVNAFFLKINVDFQ